MKNPGETLNAGAYLFTIHKIKAMNTVKDTKKEPRLLDLWPELIDQEKDFLVFLFFPGNDYGHKPELKKFKSIELHKIEEFIKQEIKQENGILRDCLLRIVQMKINSIKSKSK